jgi:hypothetical protein
MIRRTDSRTRTVSRFERESARHNRVADRGVETMSARDLLRLPYDQRRIIVVTDRKPAAMAKESAWRKALNGVGLGLLIPFAPLAAASMLRKAVDEMRRGGQNLVPVPWADAQDLHFPVGHPRKDVVYIGHPVDEPTYIPVADFHRYLFEHKVAEAQRLIRSLGARTVEVTRIEGWDQTTGINLGVSVTGSPGAPAADAKGGVGSEAAHGRTILTTMKLNPTQPPHIPEGLIWLDHEPLWKEVAAARMESGLDAFVIDVRSTDDYGVHADLKVLVASSGLDAGGQFVEHRNTVWRLQGTFSDPSD